MTKPTKWHVHPAKTQISLSIRPVWSESSLSVWRNLGSLAAHWVHSENSDQTGWMPRLVWSLCLAHRSFCFVMWHLIFFFFTILPAKVGPNIESWNMFHAKYIVNNFPLAKNRPIYYVRISKSMARLRFIKLVPSVYAPSLINGFIFGRPFLAMGWLFTL